MKTIYKKFKVKYQFICSVWEHEFMIIEAINFEQALQKCKDEIAKAYGSEMLQEVTFNQ